MLGEERRKEERKEGRKEGNMADTNWRLNHRELKGKEKITRDIVNQE